MNKKKTVHIDKENLEKALELSDLSQRKLADKINREYQSLNRSINKGSVSEDDLQAIAQELDVSPEWLKDNKESDGYYTFNYADYESFKSYEKGVDTVLKEICESLGIGGGYDSLAYLSEDEKQEIEKAIRWLLITKMSEGNKKRIQEIVKPLSKEAARELGFQTALSDVLGLRQFIDKMFMFPEMEEEAKKAGVSKNEILHKMLPFLKMLH